MNAIKVKNVSKVYKLYDKPADRLKEAINPFGKKYHRGFYALKDISFEIGKSEAVGIIGKNGSGKSTLLKLITGVLTQTSGEILVNGKISALLELGAGFNPEFTGIENIYLNGAIMGYSKEEINDRLEGILSFADIGDFVYQPVKIYSSGMFVRLGFAVSISVEPDILIVDEALSVGDMRFQQKCFRKIEELRENKTVLFVSHDLSVINKFCDRVIWVNEGTVIDDGSPLEISKKYRAFMSESRIAKYESIEAEKYNEDMMENMLILDGGLDVMGDNKAIIVGIAVFDLDNNKITLIKAGQKIKMVIKVRYNCDLDNLIVGFSLKDRLGNVVTQANSYVLNEEINTVYKGKVSVYCFEFIFPNLKSGMYTISPAVASGTQEEHVQHSWVHDALVVQIMDDQWYDLQGFMFLDDIIFYDVN